MRKWLTKNGVLAEREFVMVSVWGLGRNNFNYRKDHYFSMTSKRKLMIKTIKNSVLGFDNSCVYVIVQVGGKEVYNGNILKWKK